MPPGSDQSWMAWWLQIFPNNEPSWIARLTLLAAAVQAIGSIWAIRSAAKIARESEARAARVVEDALAREIAAEAASVARAEAAERRAEERDRLSKDEERNALLDTGIVLVAQVLKIFDGHIEHAERLNKEMPGSSLGVGFQVPQQVRDGIQALIDRSTFPPLSEIMLEVMENLGAWNILENPASVLMRFHRERAVIRKLCVALEDMRK